MHTRTHTPMPPMRALPMRALVHERRHNRACNSRFQIVGLAIIARMPFSPPSSTPATTTTTSNRGSTASPSSSCSHPHPRSSRPRHHARSALAAAAAAAAAAAHLHSQQQHPRTQLSPLSRPLPPLPHAAPRSRSMPPPLAAAASQQASTAQQQQQQDPQGESRSRICTSVTASTVEAFIAEVHEAAGRGVDVIELRLDFLKVCGTARAHVRVHACVQTLALGACTGRLRIISPAGSLRCRILTPCATWSASWPPPPCPTSSRTAPSGKGEWDARTHAPTHPRTNARAHPRTHQRTHARTHACTNARTHAPTHA